MKNFRFALLVVALFASATFLGGCNTVEGVGEDLESTGEFIADTAEDASDGDDVDSSDDDDN